MIKPWANIKANVETTKERKVPGWLEVDAANLNIKVVRRSNA